MIDEMSIAQGYGILSLAGSKFTMEMGRFKAEKSWCLPKQYVDFPLPGDPTTISPNGMQNVKNIVPMIEVGEQGRKL